NSAVYICFGIFFIAGLSKGSLILRYLWKTKFRGKLIMHIYRHRHCSQFAAASLTMFFSLVLDVATVADVAHDRQGACA
ncbi:hypothetical protein, partial [Collimonas sp.]|uniref:hypothetical protein n=1 Tax=Collimonas sp. TaxID=1963772 RepID=UPI0037C0A07E